MSATRRSRAPTITVDTSAAGPPSSPSIPLRPYVDEAHSPPSQFLSVPGTSQHHRSNSFESASSDTFIAVPSVGSAADSTSDLLPENYNPLGPDPGTEADFVVENNPFAFTPGHLSKLINPKNLRVFRALGGIVGLEKGLRTNLASGLSSDEAHLDGHVSLEDATSASPESSPSKGKSSLSRADTHPQGASSAKEGAFVDRKRVFSDNRLPERKPKSLLQLMWMAYNDKVLILLSMAAVVSLAVGIYQSVKPADGEAPVEWVEGVAIVVAIVIVVVVGALNDWQKERQFVKLNKKKEDRSIKVVRSGRIQEISVYDLLAGDVVQLEPGDVIPVDGIFIDGHNVKCDESSATGESDLLKKTPGMEVMKAMEARQSTKKMDPFMLSGAKVTEGVGKYLATATGIHSFYGKTMMSLRDEGEVTPLQSKLNVLAEYIAKLGGAAALLYFVVAFIEFIVRITRGAEQNLTAAEKGQEFLQVFIIAVSVIVVAVPEGLPLAVTLALAFATTRMLKDNNLVRLLRSCETMGVATTVCSDKTGTLTQNKMTVVAGTLGTSSRFGDLKGLSSTDSSPTSDTTMVDGDSSPTDVRADQSKTDVTPREFVNTLSSSVKDALKASIVINSTAFEAEPGSNSGEGFIGSKTETALLQFARDFLGMGPVATERSNASTLR